MASPSGGSGGAVGLCVERNEQHESAHGQHVLNLKFKRPVVRKIHKVRQLLVGDAAGIAPSEAVRSKLGDSSLIVGVDMETADWIDRKYYVNRSVRLLPLLPT